MFETFPNHGEKMKLKVQSASNTLLVTLQTLQQQYKAVYSAEDELIKLRSDVRTSQVSEKELITLRDTTQIKLDDDKAKLEQLGKDLADRETEWETRLENMWAHLEGSDTKLADLMDKSTKTYDDLILVIEDLKTNHPVCYGQIEPLIQTIEQLTQYIAELSRNRSAVASFMELRTMFEEFYTSVVIQAFGEGEAIDLGNLHVLLETKIEEAANTVQETYVGILSAGCEFLGRFHV